MKELIRKDYHFVSVSEYVVAIGGVLLPGKFIVVIDLENKELGLLTYGDLRNCTEKRIGDLDFIKPRLNLDTPLKEACELMKTCGSDALPVYLHEAFVGVLSLHDVIAYFLENLFCPQPLLLGSKWKSPKVTK